LPRLNGESPFTIEFWLQTVQLNSIVLSTWNGNEQQPYPLEIIIDTSGRLLCYRGQPGQHQSMATPQPVADGLWHHVALVYRNGEMALLLDGTLVDKLELDESSALFNTFPVSIGGRTGATPKDVKVEFEGLLDELRFWSWSRSAREIERTMHLPMEQEGQNPIVLSFDSEPKPSLLVSPTNPWNRVASDLSFLYPVNRLRAQLEEGSIQLEWQTQAHQSQRFEIERSLNGQTYEPIQSITTTHSAGESPQGTQSFSYTDFAIAGHDGVSYYRIQQHFDDGNSLASKTIKVSMVQEIPSTVLLIGNTPNPFNTSTTINYEVKEVQHIMLSVWDVSGHQVGMLVNQIQEPGVHQVLFYPDNLPSGTYFIRLQTEIGIQTGKMLLTK